MVTAEGVRSLERVVGLLMTAAERSRLATWDLEELAAFQLDTAVNEALWLATGLLEPDVVPVAVEVEQVGVLAVLEEVERELRRVAIGAYPVGTSAVVALVCDLVGEYRCLS
ncbi:hypothetical protein [Luteococcus sp.]|uniref:hypothetical protein n=1 Tax=Luteococcus sp. TaxID=1969402 RepID=UPI003734F7CF